MSVPSRTGSRPGATARAAAALVVAALVVGGLHRWSQARGEAPEGWVAATYRGLPAQGTSLGAASAPVVVEEYVDFQCPHCHLAAREIVEPLIERYVASGKVRFVYRFFPFLGPESVAAARGAYCAAVQGAFWPYQEILFERRGVGNQGTYSPASLTRYAVEAGLDEAKFGSCLQSPAARDYVAADYARARKLGLRGTPSFLVNGRYVAVSDLATLQAAVDQALAEANR